MAGNDHDAESGVLVYPRLPVPRSQFEADRSGGPRGGGGESRGTRVILAVVLLVAAGITVGAVVRPIVLPDPRIAALEEQLAAAGSAAAAQRQRALGLEQELEALGAKHRESGQRLEVAAKAEAQLAAEAEAAARRGAARAAEQKQLAAALGAAATVAASGDELRISLGAAALFGKDDALSERGKQLLDRAAAALAALGERRVTVEGHTDEAPPPRASAPAAPAAPARRGGRPAAVAAPGAPAAAPTSWELSAARAVAVVRYLQEVRKLDPARLAAAGLGSYHPVARAGRDRAANRRVVLVVAPPAAPPAK